MCGRYGIRSTASVSAIAVKASCWLKMSRMVVSMSVSYGV